MKDYNTKKKIFIAALSVICLCLAAGLIYYLSYIDRTPVPHVISADADETVSEITVSPVTIPDNDTSMDNETNETVAQNNDVDATPPLQDETLSGEKPKTPEEAIPPASPKVIDGKALTDPAKPPEYTPEQTKPDTKSDKPKGGDKKDGKIYVPGFGWVEDKGGGVEVEIAPNAGTGEKIGDM